jgi:UDP-N-acetyl-L-fucosamine synthase
VNYSVKLCETKKMKKLKVITVVGTRPEIIRLSRVIPALDRSEAIDHILVHTGQNYDYELNEIFFEDMGIRKPDHFLNAAGSNATTTIGQIIINIDPILEEEQPDAFLVLGDTNSSLCAIPAKKRRIPIFHMEAGNRCFDQRVPEETNRKIVDHIADINLCYSDISREYLLREGLAPDRVIKTGSPMYEVLHHFLPKIMESDVLQRLKLEKGKYFVVSAHREENIDNDKHFCNLLDALNQVAEKYQYPIIVTTHPRTRKRLEKNISQSFTEENTESHREKTPCNSANKTEKENEAKTPCNTVYNTVKHCETKINTNPLIQFLKPLGFTDYNALQLNAHAVLSDSGTISEESSILNFRALNIREAHERPEAMEEASVMMVGLCAERILQGLEQLHDQKTGAHRNFPLVSDYSMPNVSDKVVRIILSYTDYVKRTVWGE